MTLKPEDMVPGLRIQGSGTGNVYSVVGPHPERRGVWVVYSGTDSPSYSVVAALHLYKKYDPPTVMEVGKSYTKKHYMSNTFTPRHIDNEYAWGIFKAYDSLDDQWPGTISVMDWNSWKEEELIEF